MQYQTQVNRGEPPQTTPGQNPYLRWDWEEEMRAFWDAAGLTGRQQPAFAPVLAKYFVDKVLSLPMDMISLVRAWRRDRRTCARLAELGMVPRSMAPTTAEPPVLTSPLQLQQTMERHLQHQKAHPSSASLQTQAQLRGEGHTPCPTFADPCELVGKVRCDIRAMDAVYSETENAVWVACGGADERIYLYDALRGQCLRTFPTGHDGPSSAKRRPARSSVKNAADTTTITLLAFHPDQPRLLAAADVDMQVRVWDTQAGTLLRRWAVHTASITALIFARAGPLKDRLLSASMDHTMRVWSMQEPKTCTLSINANAPFLALALRDNGQVLITAHSRGALRLYKTRTMTLIKHVQISELK